MLGVCFYHFPPSFLGEALFLSSLIGQLDQGGSEISLSPLVYKLRFTEVLCLLSTVFLAVLAPI